MFLGFNVTLTRHKSTSKHKLPAPKSVLAYFRSELKYTLVRELKNWVTLF